MSELARILDETTIDEPLGAKLWHTLASIAAGGSTSGPLLLARLADGRVKIFPGEDCAERLERLTTEYGPVSAAFQVGCSLDGRPDVRDLRTGEVWRRDGREAYAAPPPPASERSRKAAIFAASLGMTTGALAKLP